MTDPLLVEMNDRLTGLLETDVDFSVRRIYFFGDIDAEAERSGRFIKGLYLLDSLPGDITIVLNTPGGDVETGFSIYDAIRSLENTTTIIGIGSVQSMGALIFQAGTRRLLTENCRFMIHDGTTEVAASAPVAAASRAKEYERLTSLYYRLLAQRSGQPLSRVRAWGQKETYFGAVQAVKARFADGIVKKGGRDVQPVCPP